MKTRFILGMILLAMLSLPFALDATRNASGAAFSVMRCDTDGLDLHFELPSWKLEDSTRGEDGSQKLIVDGVPYLFIDDEETLPIFSTSIAIPYTGGISYNLLNTASSASEESHLDFIPLLQAEKAAGRLPENLYPANSIRVSEPMVLREFRIVTVNIYPFQYELGTRRLKVSQNIDIRITFNDLPAANEMQPPQSYSSVFDGIYRDLIINYDTALNRSLSYSNPRMLIIYGNFNNSVFTGKVEEYANWKRQRGFIVNAVSTATSGSSSSAIKTYIQNQYNNADTRPDYIVLIGDVSGSIAIPSYSSYIDYYYTWLAGSDNLGDAIIGRISVESADQMVNYMGKINSFEQNLNLNTAAFLNRMLLSAETSQSGISTIYTSRYIKDLSKRINPAYTYAEEYGSPSPANANTAINQGVAFYNYRGWINMNGWPSSMSGMNNAYRLFHAVFLTCATGNYHNGTSTTESVVRYGTATTMGGGITAIGMASSSTTTPQNNCANMGIFHGIYNLGYRDMGAAMLYGKLFLYTSYSGSNANYAYDTAGYINLIGDPAAAVYVGIPTAFNIVAPSSIPSGQSTLEVIVNNASNIPVPAARVALTNASGIQILGFSGDDGLAILSLPSTLSGSYSLTVTKDDHKSAVSSITISPAGGIVYQSQLINDDGQGSSQGNGDGIVNAGETIECYAILKNTSASTISPTAQLVLNDPYLALMGTNNFSFDSIAAGQTGQNTQPIVFDVDPSCPDQYHTYLKLIVTGGAETYQVLLPITVRSAKIEKLSHAFVGATGNVICPGDQFPMTITLKNSGVVNLSGAQAILRSRDPFFSIEDSLAVYGSLNVGQSATNTIDQFAVFARAVSITGMVVPLELEITAAAGFVQNLDFEVVIGQPALNQPLGQDAYGYFIFDDSDTGYPQCPSYQWLGIAPAEGGSGTALTLTDPGASGDEGDQMGSSSIQTVNLPFTFKFYGVEYSQASISANGFISFGETQNSDWRNWKIPDAGGPSQMIAAFWDDLEFTTGSGVYTWFNAAEHCYVVEWYNLRNGYNRTSEETFQAILYDPIYYPTHTGDGQIKLQYKVVNNVDLGASGGSRPHGLYASVGIEDHTGTVGLEYTFNNQYPSTCKPLQNQMALFITTRPILSDLAYLEIENIHVIDPNGNGMLEPGETASLAPNLVNFGLQDALNVTATLSSSDPMVTITNAQVSYGDILAQTAAMPQNNFGVSIAESCASGHGIVFNLIITATNGTWSRTFPLYVQAAEFSLENQLIVDTGGNNNGTLDPGETANLSIRLYNRGQVSALTGSATLSCSNPGITINTGTVNFPNIPAGGYSALTFSISAATSMPIGTLVQLNFSVTSGFVNYAGSTDLEVGAPLLVTIGNGTSTQTYPLDRYYNYSAHEAIYLASEIGTAGSIKTMAYYKGSGADTSPIESVSIYMKHTTQSTLSSGSYSLNDYTLVYSGTFTNNAASGWMEITLDQLFGYDGTSNLSILVLKDYQQWISNYSNYRNSNTTTRARQNRSDSSLPTSLTSTNSLPNLQLRLFAQATGNLPPNGVTATPSHASVLLEWEEPFSGNPDAYKIFRNHALIATVNALSYNDTNLTNGISYVYFIKAVYGGADSESSETVSATPNALPPSNLTAIPGNGSITLSWNAPAGRNGLGTSLSESRTINSYKIFRNSALIATITQNSFMDVGLINGNTYTYYVKTVYTNPNGESEASESVSATPSDISFIDIGSETSANTGSQNAPLNICNNSVHGQLVYTAAELNAAGLNGPTTILGLGFNVVSSPSLPLPDFLVRLKHTAATDANDWQDATNLITTYTNANYMPTSGGWDMLMFSQPFEWNGTDNLLVDTAFGLVSEASTTGTIQYTTIDNGYRFAWSNTEDQTNVFTGGMSVARRYNVRFACQQIVNGAQIEISLPSIYFGEVDINTFITRSLSISNPGNQDLSGTIVTPNAFSIASMDVDGREHARARNQIDISIPAGLEASFVITFYPTSAQLYSGNVMITSNALNAPNYSLAVSGTGKRHSLATAEASMRIANTRPTITWKAVPDAKSYTVCRSTSPKGPFIPIITTTQTKYTETEDLPQAFYQVVVNR